jgi:integrase
MARPSKTAAIDYAAAHDLTHGLLERATCPPDKPFVLVRDDDKKGLRLRVTQAGGKHWQFETRIKGKLFTRALGEWPAVSIDDAKAEAHRLRGLTESGTDPRDIERQQAADKAAADRAFAAADAAKAQQEAAQALTVGEAWAVYLAERKPRWGELHYKDHVKLARAGGVPAKRGTDGRGVTIDMPLFPLMALPLCDLTAPVIEAWAAKEALTRPTSARLAWRLLKGFLGWCAEQPGYAGLLPAANPAKTKKSREAFGKAGVKSDVLQRGQLKAWFAAVRQIQNPVIAAYLQTMLLTGARPGEVLALRWDDVNTKWKGLTIRDKVEGLRVIPLTPYLGHLLAALPKRNEWVFSSTRAVSLDDKNTQRRARRANAKGAEVPAGDVIENSATGHITEPRSHLNCACAVAGIEGLTLHGLRRSFKSLTEWLEIPAGVVAQLMGHKPSATAEKHYTVRPLDLLAIHHERIEAWMLEQAGIVFDAKAAPGALRLVAG